jgi:hypothetical protein
LTAHKAETWQRRGQRWEVAMNNRLLAFIYLHTVVRMCLLSTPLSVWAVMIIILYT